MSKSKIVPISIILFLLLVIAGGLWYWNTYKKGIIRSELERTVREKSEGLYKVHYDNLELDEINGRLSVSSFTLVHDSIRFAQLQSRKKEPFLLFNIVIPHIQVEGVKTPRALLEKEITGRLLVITNPVIEILYTNSGMDSTRTVPDKEIYEQILGNLNLIRVDSVLITGAEIITKNLKSGKTLVHFQNASVSMLGVAVDSTADADTTRLLFAKEINIDCEKFSWQSKDKLYDYAVDSIAFRSAISNISIKKISVIPLLKENAFMSQFPVQTDRLDFVINNLQFKNTNFYQLINEAIIVDTLVIGSASFKLYRDRNFPRDNKNRVGTYPHQAIQKLPVSVQIKNAVVKNTFLEYKEKNPVTRQSGKVQFWNLFANISNITNRKEIISANNMMTIDIQTHLLNKIPLSTKWTFYLGNPDGRFDISGRMGQADVNLFNTLAEPMGPARLNKGHINSLKFDFAGTNYRMKGNVTLLYKDLQVSLLKKDEDLATLKKKKIASLLANMKIKNSNPENNKAPRSADVDYKRNTNTSIFSLAWKSLFEAVKEIAGVK